MSISLRNVIETLCPTYKLESDIESHTSIDTYEKSTYVEKNQYYQVIRCLCDVLNINLSSIFDECEILNKFILSHNFIEMLNMRKITVAIEDKVINNDLMLFLSAYFNCNIYVYYENCKILKIYYIEEIINLNKENVLMYFDPTDVCKYQINKIPTKYSHDHILKCFPNILIAALGLGLNKQIIYGESESLRFAKKINNNVLATDYINEINIKNINFPGTNVEIISDFIKIESKKLIIIIKNIYKRYSRAKFTKNICI